MRFLPVLFLALSASMLAQQHRDFGSDLTLPAAGTSIYRAQEEAGLQGTAAFSKGKKNVGLAAIYSLLIPGMGELYVGRYDIGKYFSIAEAGLWITWGAFRLEGGWIRDDSRAFAVQYAGVRSTSGSDQYFIDIGNFDNVDAYNEQVLRDRDPQKLYDRNSELAWSWVSPQIREEYRQMRLSSENIFNNSRFVFAAIGVNHLISAINAARLAVIHNKSLEDFSGLSVHADIMGTLRSPHGIMLTFSKTF